MDKKIKVSVITVCYNSEKTIKRTIESVLNQTYQNVEYIIVDGASTDGTLAIVDSYRAAFGDRLRVVSEPDTGIYNAMNKGIRMATGEIVGIVNSDDFYEPDAVERVVDNYDGEKYEVLYGIVRNFRGDKMLDALMYTHHNLGTKTILHPAVFVTKATYDDIALYDEKYPAVADYDFLLKMNENEAVKFLPIYYVLSNFSVEGVSSSIKAKKESIRMQKEHKIISPFVYFLKWINIYMNYYQYK